MKAPDFASCDGFDWDEGNRRKVALRMDLEIAEAAFLGEPIVAFDELHSRSELRWILINRVNERFIALIFTVRGRKIRIISARYMHAKEMRKYGKKIG